jgi:hypothetical protein
MDHAVLAAPVRVSTPSITLGTGASLPLERLERAGALRRRRVRRLDGGLEPRVLGPQDRTLSTIASGYAGFGATMLDKVILEAFPRSVLPDERRRRVYWSGVLARVVEEGAPYRPARKLWRRERQGNYVPSASTRHRTVGDDGAERFVPLRDLLRVGLLDELGRVG